MWKCLSQASVEVCFRVCLFKTSPLGIFCCNHLELAHSSKWRDGSTGPTLPTRSIWPLMARAYVSAHHPLSSTTCFIDNCIYASLWEKPFLPRCVLCCVNAAINRHLSTEAGAPQLLGSHSHLNIDQVNYLQPHQSAAFVSSVILFLTPLALFRIFFLQWPHWCI